MNPIITFVLFMLLYQENNHFPNYFDTFKIEKVLDKVNHTVQSLDRINHLNELAHEPLVKGNLATTIEDSIHTVKPLFPDGKPQQHLDTVESILNSIKKVGGLQNMAQSLGPMMSILNNFSAPSDNGDSQSYLDSDYDSGESAYNSGRFREKEDPYL